MIATPAAVHPWCAQGSSVGTVLCLRYAWRAV